VALPPTEMLIGPLIELLKEGASPSACAKSCEEEGGLGQILGLNAPGYASAGRALRNLLATAAANLEANLLSKAIRIWLGTDTQIDCSAMTTPLRTTEVIRALYGSAVPANKQKFYKIGQRQMAVELAYTLMAELEGLPNEAFVCPLNTLPPG
jgi:hypothetical protein